MAASFKLTHGDLGLRSLRSLCPTPPWALRTPRGGTQAEKDVIIIEVLQKIYETFLNTGVRKVLVKVDKTRGVFSPEVNKYIKERG